MLQQVCCDVRAELAEELGGTKNRELVDTACLSKQDGEPYKTFCFCLRAGSRIWPKG
jgi:hypothetical protein